MQRAVELPLFPLQTVLYPGGRLALRIFETRYLDMISRCMRDGGDFGVVAIASGAEVGEAETHAVGTRAAIVDWERLPDGLLGITVSGGARFRLQGIRRNADGLYVGTAVPCAEEPPVELPAEARGLAELLRRALTRVGRADEVAGGRFADASWVGYRLAEVLPLTLADRQRLLEEDDALARLAMLGASMRIE